MVILETADRVSAAGASAAELRSRFIAMMDLLSALRRLLAAGDTLSSEDALLQTALSELAAHMHLGFCSVFLKDGEELVCVAGTGFEESLARSLGLEVDVPGGRDSMRFRVGDGIMGYAYLTGELQSSNDCRNDPRFKAGCDSTHDDRIGSLVAIPLKESGAVYGVLNVSHPETGFFDSWHQNALYLFADSVSRLVTNFRLANTIDLRVASRTGALEQALSEAQRMRDRYEQLATVDELTGLHNRRHFFYEAPRMVAAAQRTSVPLTLVIGDLDEFKRINDTWGHGYGDQMLIRAAEVFETALRGGDLLARLGGEEFVLLLPDTLADGAVRLARRINENLPDLPPSESHPAKRLTASFGVAPLTDEMVALAPSEALGLLYARGDKAMYKCKTQGRACVEIYSETLEADSLTT